MKKHRHNKGFSLIEILVAVLILGIGLLGVAAMQVMSLQNITSSESRTHATLLANELGELARAQPGSINDFDVDRTDECPDSGVLEIWCRSLQQALPDAEYELTWTAGDRTLDIELWWYEREMWAQAEDEDDPPPTGETMSNYSYQVRFR